MRLAPGVTLPASALEVSVPVSPTWQISPSGTLAKPAVVTIPLTRREPNDGLTVIFTAESPRGPWTPLKTKVVHGGMYAQATVTHLSWFRVVRISADDVMSVLRAFFNALTSDATSNALPPDCQGTGPQARTDGYSITSASGSTVFWCFGMQNGSRVLKVVNNRRYPLLLIHGMPVIGGDGTGDMFQRAAELLSTSGVVAWPQSEIDFGATVQPGYWAGVSANVADEGQYLYSLDVGVQALFEILSRFGFGDQPTKVMTVVNDLLSLDTCRASLGNVGAMISSCLQSDVIDKVVGFGYSWVLSGIATLTAVWEYFRGSLNGLADQFDGRSRYWIKVTHVVQAAPYSTYLGRYVAHDTGLCIGQALDLTGYNGSNQPPCSGSGTIGWLREWGCGFIALPTAANPSPPCGYAWAPLTFTYHADGTVTISYRDLGNQTVCTPSGSGKQVPCAGLQPEGLLPLTMQLLQVKPGIIKMVYSVQNSYWGSFSLGLCATTLSGYLIHGISQADAQRYCPNA